MIQPRFAANKAGFQAGGVGFAMNDAGSGAQAGEFAAGGGGCGQDIGRLDRVWQFFKSWLASTPPNYMHFEEE
jgi:hypothetical protein